MRGDLVYSRCRSFSDLTESDVTVGFEYKKLGKRLLDVPRVL